MTFPSPENNGRGSCHQPTTCRNTAHSHSDRCPRSGTALRSWLSRNLEACNILLLWVFLKWGVQYSTSPIWVASRQELRHPSLHHRGTALAGSTSLPKWMERPSLGGQILSSLLTRFPFLIEVYLIRWSWTGVCWHRDLVFLINSLACSNDCADFSPSST